jgi:hypothetical protein
VKEFQRHECHKSGKRRLKKERDAKQAVILNNRDVIISKGDVMKRFMGRKAYLLSMLVMSVFVGAYSGPKRPPFRRESGHRSDGKAATIPL